MCSWTIDWEHLSVSLVVISLHQWELDRRIVELFDVVTTSLGGDDLFNLDDLKPRNENKSITEVQKQWAGDRYLNWMSTSAMAGSHVRVALCDCTSDGQVAVLTVHVVCTWTGIVSKPDSEVLDLQWSLLVLALHWDDLTSSLLELTQLTQEVPEAGLGYDVIRGEDDHLEQWWIWILFGRQFASDDLILLQLKYKNKLVSDAATVEL